MNANCSYTEEDNIQLSHHSPSGLTSVPHNAKVHYNFANLQKDLGNIENAVEHYKMALSLWPNHASAHNNLGTLLPDTQQAENHFKLALLINSHHPRALFNLASLYRHSLRLTPLATIYAEDGRLEDAESLHLKALDRDPNNADSFNNYGTFLQKSGRMEEAVQQYRQAMRLQPNHTVAIVNAARSLRALKNNREAEELYKRALSINSDPKIMDNLGVLYISAGRFADASKLYKELYEKHSDYVEGRVHFAQVLMQERSFPQAEMILQSVIKENDTHRDALHQLSILYSQVNKTAENLWQSLVGNGNGNGNPYGNPLTYPISEKGLIIRPKHRSKYSQRITVDSSTTPSLSIRYHHGKFGSLVGQPNGKN
ncbi:transmembrane and TPR repeat-containing protein 1 [Caerostris extrusa]|uniref:Transmembrane and TPR repeat-containing protein 1 n=1 Tax=Caerostris extrusa TaxID=172846 RepID=A0AAV4M633_CAEEX|nr:transmembrane and TPR repeat-containing protein 1 [Caerostris extrusa]